MCESLQLATADTKDIVVSQILPQYGVGEALSRSRTSTTLRRRSGGERSGGSRRRVAASTAAVGAGNALRVPLITKLAAVSGDTGRRSRPATSTT